MSESNMKTWNNDCKKELNGDMCCCNCKHLRKLFKHPMNNGVGDGRITDLMGYVCTSSYPEDGIIDTAIFFDGEHGMCETWEKKIKL